MNLLRSIFGNRRERNEKAQEEKRGGLLVRGQVASMRKDAALEELTKTLSMSTGEFRALLAREAKEAGEPEIAEVILFEPFADICEFRYSPKDSLMALCKHPEHDAHSTGIAACREGLCPKLLAAARKK